MSNVKKQNTVSTSTTTSSRVAVSALSSPTVLLNTINRTLIESLPKQISILNQGGIWLFDQDTKDAKDVKDNKDDKDVKDAMLLSNAFYDRMMDHPLLAYRCAACQNYFQPFQHGQNRSICISQPQSRGRFLILCSKCCTVNNTD
jgi:hypothetical protein